MRGHRQGNVAGEWAIMLAVVTAAFLAMPILLKQSVAGRLQRSSDSVSSEPYYYERVEGQERLSITASRRETVRTESLPDEPNKTIVTSVIGAVPCCAWDPTCDLSCVEVTTRSRHAETLEDVYAPLFDR